MRHLLLFLVLIAPGLAMADPFAHAAPGVMLAGEYTRPEPQGILPSQQSPKIGSQQAASSVKRTFADRKILSVKLMDAKGPPVYRVKTLSDDGVVGYVYVDGNSGDVFE